MIEIRLPNNSWEYDPQKLLGKPGGFGTVFLGQSATGLPVAVKRLHLHAAEAAHRELQMADSLVKRDLLCVLSIYDAGQDANSDYYFIVMPVAEKSLRQDLEACRQIEEQLAINILLQIAQGLEEVNDVIHRDIKPENILYHEGRWKIADFGIARFVENATSLQTLKDALSPYYAAPEQWLMQTPSKTTDIYALGCIAYELLTGRPPFQGNTIPVLMDQHLKTLPPTLSLQSNLFGSLIQMMLRKQPDSRPQISRVISILHNCAASFAVGPRRVGVQSLEKAGAIIAQQDAQTEAEKATQDVEFKRRAGLHADGMESFKAIIQTIAQQISSAAPSCRIIQHQSFMLICDLGTAKLTLSYLDESKHIPYSKDKLQNSDWDIISGAIIKVSQSGTNSYVWGANLWYMNWKNLGYRWIEVMYMDNPLMRKKRSEFEPYGVTEVELADRAAAKAIDVIQLASKPYPADDEDLNNFSDRWLARFAEASIGRLSRPHSLPI